MDILTTTEAAKLLNLTAERVRQLIDTGRLPAERLESIERSHRRIKRTDLEAFAKANHVTLDWSRLSQ